MPNKLDKIVRDIESQGLLGTSGVIIQRKPEENPFLVIDSTDSVLNNPRILTGASQLTVTDDIKWRRIGLKLVATNATQVLTYTSVIDLSSSFFDAIEDPCLIIAFKSLSSLSALSAGNRTVKVKFIDNASIPISFSNDAVSPTNVNVPEMDYIIGSNAENGQEVIYIPISKLSQSTTKKFAIQITFNLPIAHEYILHNIGLYRAGSDSILVGFDPVFISAPKNFKDTSENAGGKQVKGSLGQILAIKDQARNMSVEFETQSLNLKHARILQGLTASQSGRGLTNVIEFAIPLTPNGGGFYELSSINQLSNTDTYKDILISIDDGTGSYKEARVIEGGLSLPTGFVRYVRETTKVLQFSASDKGKKIKIQLFYNDPQLITENLKGITKTIGAEVTTVMSDSSDLESGKIKVLDTIKNVTVNTSVISTDFASEELPRLSVKLASLNKNITDVLATRTYKA